MSTDVEHKLELWLKIIGFFGLILGAVIGIGEYVYTANRQAALETNRFAADQNRLVLEKQTELYFQAALLAGKLAVEPNGPERTKDFRAFEEIYYGPMVIVEDRGAASNPPVTAAEPGVYARTRNVEGSMVDFHNCYLDEHCSAGSGLKQHALQLADSCRLSLAQTTQERVSALRTQLSLSFSRR
jgi:hypothetical protein